MNADTASEFGAFFFDSGRLSSNILATRPPTADPHDRCVRTDATRQPTATDSSADPWDQVHGDNDWEPPMFTYTLATRVS